MSIPNEKPRVKYGKTWNILNPGTRTPLHRDNGSGFGRHRPADGWREVGEEGIWFYLGWECMSGLLDGQTYFAVKKEVNKVDLQHNSDHIPGPTS